jgi:hypothetical protein
MKLAGVAIAAASLLLMLPAAARADVIITPSCTASGATGACSSGWYTSDVTVSFSLSGSGFSNPTGCGNQAVTADTGGMLFRCTVDLSGGGVVGAAVTIKRDATSPTATGIAAGRGADSGGWYNHPLPVTVTGIDSLSGIASCTAVKYSGPDSGAASAGGTCTDNAGNVSAAKTLSFQYDATAPGVSPAPGRAADANGWYNHPVDVAFQGSDAVSGIDACTSASYSGPDNGSASVAGTCRDKAGNTASGSFALRYDATPPAAPSGTADRPPDSNGWYNHRLAVTFTASDVTSGIASCDAPSYEKPNDAAATLTGHCRDNAGNASPDGSFAFKFDSTPPKLEKLVLNALDRAVTMTWSASSDVAAITIVRDGPGAAAPATVYDGKRVNTFTDKSARNGTRYTYIVAAFDDAGNKTLAKGIATPSAPLLAPRASAHVKGGTTLRWRAVAHATYYNVQLWLRGKKVLTRWPTGTSMNVPRLRPGRYTWLVWPGLGARAKHHYGPLIGKSTFVVSG